MNDKNHFGIYKIVSPSGKIYIGQTVKSKSRYSDYKRMSCKKQRLLYNSLQKHGFENHSFSMVHILDTLYMSKIEIYNELNRLEMHYIDFYKSFVDDNENGMNLNRGGNVNIMSKETRSKISLSQTGKTPTIETRAKIGKANRGQKRTPEQIEEIRINSTGRIRTEESKKKMSDKMKGKVFSEEHRKNISKAKNGVKMKKTRSEESRLKTSLALKGKKKSPEAVKKSADSKRGKKQGESELKRKSLAWMGENNPNYGKIGKDSPNYGKKPTPETRAKISLANKGRKLSEETKKRQSEAKKGKKQSEETKAKRRGKKLSPESISKREATRKRNRELIEEEKRMMIF